MSPLGDATAAPHDLGSPLGPLREHHTPHIYFLSPPPPYRLWSSMFWPPTRSPIRVDRSRIRLVRPITFLPGICLETAMARCNRADAGLVSRPPGSPTRDDRSQVRFARPITLLPDVRRGPALAHRDRADEGLMLRPSEPNVCQGPRPAPAHGPSLTHAISVRFA